MITNTISQISLTVVALGRKYNHERAITAPVTIGHNLYPGMPQFQLIKITYYSFWKEAFLLLREPYATQQQKGPEEGRTKHGKKGFKHTNNDNN